MRQIKILAGLLLALFAICFSASAQLSTTLPDPLARIREAAQGNTQACSATGESLCEQVAPKIIANAEGHSPLAENLHRLTHETDEQKKSPHVEDRVVAWAVAAFRDAGLDVHTEKYATRAGVVTDRENVVAEIRGREKPDEWVLLGAHLDSWAHVPGVLDSSCDAATVVEAARDILVTGARPRRSIRFVLFTGEKEGASGSSAYVHAHRAELDRARAAIISSSSCLQLTGYLLNGRHDIEPGVREAMKPIESLGASHYEDGALFGTDNFDFILEGVPALTAVQRPAPSADDSPALHGVPDKIDIADLKRNAAIVAVTAFGIAERATSIGPRQSRTEIESLLKTSGLGSQMKSAGLWTLWESGQRGRLP